MLAIKSIENPVSNEVKRFTRLRYELSNTENGNVLDIRTNLYDDGHMISYVYTFKKNFINRQVEEYLGCSIKECKNLLYTL